MFILNDDILFWLYFDLSTLCTAGYETQVAEAQQEDGEAVQENAGKGETENEEKAFEEAAQTADPLMVLLMILLYILHYPLL